MSIFVVFDYVFVFVTSNPDIQGSSDGLYSDDVSSGSIIWQRLK